MKKVKEIKNNINEADFGTTDKLKHWPPDRKLRKNPVLQALRQ